MNVILILILSSLGMAVLFLGAFIWAVRSGQYEDTCTPSVRVLTEEDRSRPKDPIPSSIEHEPGNRNR